MKFDKIGRPVSCWAVLADELSRVELTFHDVLECVLLPAWLIHAVGVSCMLSPDLPWAPVFKDQVPSSQGRDGSSFKLGEAIMFIEDLDTKC